MESIREVNQWGSIVYTNEKDQYHREDGPAIERPNGLKVWWVNGKRHREDGPAKIYSDGDVEYWLNDLFYDSKDNWEKEVIKIKLKRILDL
jgi:hypothetical protein